MAPLLTRSWATLLPCLLLAGFLLAACGGGDAPPPPAPSTGSAAPAPAPAKKPAPSGGGFFTNMFGASAAGELPAGDQGRRGLPAHPLRARRP